MFLSKTAVMVRYQSLVALMLGLVAFMLVGCSGPSFRVETPTYSEAQVERIQQYIPEISTARDRLQNELIDDVRLKDWQEVRAFVHGPLGQMLLDMNYLARNLPPQAQKNARQVTKALVDDLIDIDQAAQKEDARAVSKAYKVALEDVNTFFQLIPEAAQAQPEAAAKLLELPTRLEAVDTSDLEASDADQSSQSPVEPEETGEIVPDKAPQAEDRAGLT